MSQENVDATRAAYEQFSCGDFSRVFEASTDDFELVTAAEMPDAGTYRGQEARDWILAYIHYYPVQKFPEARPCHGVEEIARFQVDYRDAWERYEMEVNELIPVSDDRVLAHSTIRAEGRESGVKLDGDLYQCVWLRHGHFMRWEDHLSLKGALRALGLSGETLEAAGLRE